MFCPNHRCIYERYGCAGYTCINRSKVKGQYVERKASLIEKIKDVFD